MTKVDIQTTLSNIVKELNCGQFLEMLAVYLASNRETAAQPQIELTKAIVAAKSKYDYLTRKSNYQAVFNAFEAEKIYSDNAISELLRLINQADSGNHLYRFGKFTRYVNFQEILLSLFRGLPKMFFSESDNADGQTEIKYEILYLEAVDANQNLRLYSRVFALLDELLMLINKIFSDSEIPVSIAYIESGSPLSIAVKGVKKATRSFANTVHEIWRFVADRHNYREARRDEALHSKLDLIERIAEMEKSGKLNGEDAKNLKTRVTKTVCDLMDEGVVTREIAEQVIEVQAREVVGAKTGKLLKKPKN